MRDAARMRRNMPQSNVITAHKIAIHVINHLVRIYIAVVVWRWNRLWMVVVKARDKRTHHKSVGMEGLMHRWRLMDSPSDRLKIVDRETPRKIVAVPTHYIKGMRSIYHFV